MTCDPRHGGSPGEEDASRREADAENEEGEEEDDPPAVTVAQLLHCAPTAWSGLAGRAALLPAAHVPLPRAVVQALLADGVFLPDDSEAVSKHTHSLSKAAQLVGFRAGID